jgi:hypothetical protein
VAWLWEKRTTRAVTFRHKLERLLDEFSSIVRGRGISNDVCLIACLAFTCVTTELWTRLTEKRLNNKLIDVSQVWNKLNAV